jgi:hypothetical protein
MDLRGILRQGSDPLNPPSSRFPTPSWIKCGVFSPCASSPSTGQASAAHRCLVFGTSTENAHTSTEELAIAPCLAALTRCDATVGYILRRVTDANVRTCAVRATRYRLTLGRREAGPEAAPVDARDRSGRADGLDHLTRDQGEVAASRNHAAPEGAGYLKKFTAPAQRARGNAANTSRVEWFSAGRRRAVARHDLEANARRVLLRATRAPRCSPPRAQPPLIPLGGAGMRARPTPRPDRARTGT